MNMGYDDDLLCLPSRRSIRSDLESEHALVLHSTFDSVDPTDTILGVRLDGGLELSLMEREVVHGPDTKESDTRISLTNAVHEGPTSVAEVVCHLFARSRGDVLAPGLEVLLAAEVLEVLIGDGEV